MKNLTNGWNDDYDDYDDYELSEYNLSYSY